jgi:hypothetical protein
MVWASLGLTAKLVKRPAETERDSEEREGREGRGGKGKRGHIIISRAERNWVAIKRAARSIVLMRTHSFVSSRFLPRMVHWCSIVIRS